MTPPAAARSLKRPESGSRRSSVRHPRRISGPGNPLRPGAVAAAVAVPAPGIALPGERKRRPGSSPRRRPAPKRTRPSTQATPGVALRAVHAFQDISSSTFLDRLIRGRLWIGLLAFALIGIVAMQLLVLKLNTGIGRTLGHVATLQRENAQLGIEDSMYSAEGRVAPVAAATGMVPAPAGAVHFVTANKADVSHAASVLSTPIQASAAGVAEASSATGGESPASIANTGSEVSTSSAASSQTPGSGGEVPGSSESSSSTVPNPGGGESTTGSNEPQSAKAPSGTAPSTVSPPTPASSAPSVAGAQAAAPAEPSSLSMASGTQASGPGGGTQARTQE